MYKVLFKNYNSHVAASKAAKEKSRILPVKLKAPTGGAWYWRGKYCGRKLLTIFYAR